LDRALPVEIAEAVRTGPYLMPRFSEKQIGDAELDSIIRYVTYARNPDDRGGWALGHVGPVPEGLVAWFIGIAVLVAMCLVIGRGLQSCVADASPRSFSSREVCGGHRAP